MPVGFLIRQDPDASRQARPVAGSFVASEALKRQERAPNALADCFEQRGWAAAAQ